MTNPRTRRLAAVLAVLGLAATAPARADDENKTSPTVAREAAEANAKTPAGRRYATALESSLDRWLARAIERCGKGVAPEEGVSFEVFVRIRESGEAAAVVATPETAIARCAEKDFRDASYPHPPQDGWWVRIPIGLK